MRIDQKIRMCEKLSKIMRTRDFHEIHEEFCHKRYNMAMNADTANTIRYDAEMRWHKASCKRYAYNRVFWNYLDILRGE